MDEQLLDGAYNPASLSHAKNPLLEGQTGYTELLTGKQGGHNRVLSDSEYAQQNEYATTFDKGGRVVARGAEILSAHAVETDSQVEYAGARDMLSQFSHNNITPPTVNVIKSNTQIG